ncbi:hypothetical protein BGZ79_008495 [Entomortierella chlamydospora]|nr:hypothetical protein BGZ79_008495 [Entomortierella chlamydospora]
MYILDVGCGPGSISVDLARLVRNGHVVGVDYTPEPFEEANALAAQQGATNVNFQVGGSHALNPPDDTSDIIHAHQVLQHVADPTQALREMRKVVKPGGIVASHESVTTSCYSKSPGLEAYWDLKR